MPLHTFTLTQHPIVRVSHTNTHSFQACRPFDRCSGRGAALACLHARNFSCVCMCVFGFTSLFICFVVVSFFILLMPMSGCDCLFNHSRHSLACQKIFKRVVYFSFFCQTMAPNHAHCDSARTKCWLAVLIRHLGFRSRGNNSHTLRQNKRLHVRDMWSGMCLSL